MCARCAKFIFLLGIFLSVHSINPISAQQTEQPDFIPGEIIVGFTSPEARASAVQDLQQMEQQGGVRGNDASSTDIGVEPIDATSIRIKLKFVMRNGGMPNKATERQLLIETAEAFRQDDRVAYAHPNWIMQLQRPRIRKFLLFEPENIPRVSAAIASSRIPNDPVFGRGLHWHYLASPRGMNAIGMWEHATDSKGVIIAVLDTGILPDHPDIKNSGNVLPGYDFVSFPTMRVDGDGWDSDPTDPGDACGEHPSSWHGTHVAGTIGAGATNNDIGIAGIAWRADVMSVRVLGRCGGAIADIAAAIKWAAGIDLNGVPKNQKPADIINMSLGIRLACTQENVGALIEAIDQAHAAGATIVVAAGNDNIDIANVSPGSCTNVISVAASDGRGHLAPYSNFGAVTIMAPGGDLERDDDGDGYADGVWSVKAGAIIPQ